MSSERLIGAFDDIVHVIDLIEAWVKDAGGSEVALRPDTQARSAIERQLLIISEAAIRMHKIDSAAPARLASAIDWPGVRGVGNFIRHKYDDLDGAIIAGVVGERLSTLRGACSGAAKRLREGK